MPSLDRGYYWQPVFREFTQRFPNTVVFTSLWSGFRRGFDGTFSVRRLHGLRHFTLKNGNAGVESSFTWASLSILLELLRFRPHVILTGGFNLWTLCALPFRLFGRSRLILLWDGISPFTVPLHAPIRLTIRRVMARFFDACISNTEEGICYLRQILAVPDSKLRQHPYEVPNLEFLQSADGREGVPTSCARPVFLYVGQITRQKGIGSLLQACSLLRKRGLTHFSLLLVGDGEDRTALGLLANELGLQDQVHWIGMVEYERLGAFYRACDVLVFPTKSDVWGMVVLEAMTFGNPILCSKYAGSREMVSHGSNGFVFDANDPVELAGYMARFIREPALIEKFGAVSKQMLTPYTTQSAARVLAATVLNVLEPQPQSPNRV